MPDLRLVFLWRGVLLPELLARVRKLDLSPRVEIVQDWVDVSRVWPGSTPPRSSPGTRGWSRRIPTRSWKRSPPDGRWW